MPARITPPPTAQHGRHRQFKESLGTLCKAVLPFIAILVVWPVIVVTVPALSLVRVGA